MKIHRFEHERIPERVVHARGAGAFGTFKLYESAANVTNAGVLTDTSRNTPVFLRPFTVLGSRVSGDTVRDVRGLAVKFYTEEGNWDIVGNGIPVFFIQDAIKFTDLIHAAKPEPDVEVPQAQTAHNNFWDFAYLHAKATHMFMWAMSDRGIPRSYRMMQGFGVSTYTLTNAKSERHFVNFHFTPNLGVHSFVWDEALKLAGQDPDFHPKDLYEVISQGVFPTWKFGIQTLKESQERDFDFDVLDATKVSPEERVPVKYIGELELNPNVDEYFTQTEQAAFAAGQVVPGLVSPTTLSNRGESFLTLILRFLDLALIGRSFPSIARSVRSWIKTGMAKNVIRSLKPKPITVCVIRNRSFLLGNELLSQAQLPTPKICLASPFRTRIKNANAEICVGPNRWDSAPPAKPSKGGYVDFPEKVAGIKTRLKSKKFEDHISQAQLFWNSQSPPEKMHLISALGFELDHCDNPVVYNRMTERLCDIDLELAQAVAEKVGAPTPTKQGKANKGQKSAGLSITA